MLAEADAEARRLGHSYIGPEHLLVALAAHASGASRSFFVQHGMSTEVLREAVAALIGPERVTGREHGALALAHRTVVALAHALTAGDGARHWPEPYSADDLLAALLSEDVAGAATLAALLDDAGVTVDAARGELARLRARETSG